MNFARSCIAKLLPRGISKRGIVITLRIVGALGFLFVAISPRPPIWGQRNVPVWHPPSQEALDQKQDDEIEELLATSSSNKETVRRIWDAVNTNRQEIAALKATHEAESAASGRREMTTTIATSGSGLMVLASVVVPLLPIGKRRKLGRALAHEE